MCINCEKGSFSASLGSTTCVSCAPGTFGANSKMTSCFSCEAGKYNSLSGQALCQACDGFVTIYSIYFILGAITRLFHNLPFAIRAQLEAFLLNYIIQHYLLILVQLLARFAIEAISP